MSRKDAILHAVALTGELLLAEDGWTDRIDSLLGHLGRATEVDRVYVFDIITTSGGEVTSQRHEWVADGVDPQIDNPELQDIPMVEAGFGRWLEELAAGRPVSGEVKDFPESEHHLLEAQGILSLVVVPIDVGGLWGFVGFDATTPRAPWQPAEIDALRTAAGVLGAAIRNEQLLADLRQSRASYVEAFRREREAGERLRELDELRNTFLDAVSHELRTPLHTLLGISETLLQHRERLSATQQDDLLARLGTNARRLDAILESLLDLNRLRRGNMAVERVSTGLDGFLRATVSGCDALAGLAVEVDVEDADVWVDRTLLERIVVNLLENAVVHAAGATSVWVRARMAHDLLILTVSDDGPGVREEHREEIFEPFAHGYVRRAHAPGTGMGLALVQRFAALHGGSARCEARDGGGASFVVELLAAESSATMSDSPDEATQVEGSPTAG